jgi:hypothetical protein
MTGGHETAAALLAAMALSTSAIAADALPEPSLQLSRQLTLQPPGQVADETERALLRVEWKAAQSDVEESAAVDDMMLRLQRLGHSMAELRTQIAKVPSAPRIMPQPVPLVAPPPEAEPGYWPWAVGVIAALALVAALRRRFRRRAPIDETIFDPQDATHTAVLPDILLKEPQRTLAPPTIASEPGPADDDRPPAEVDRSPAPPGDDQIPLELADILASMGLVDGAIKTLEEFIREHPRRALGHWLKLLDVYRRAGMQKEFEAAATSLNQHFNVAPSEWGLPNPAAPAFALERYPHLRSRVEHLWRRRGCNDYLTQLLEDNRDGTRSGLPQSVVEEILFLQAILRS